jgi:hypothetical protein
MVPVIQEVIQMTNAIEKLVVDLMDAEASDLSKSITLATDTWAPVYREGDTLVIWPVSDFMKGDHAMFISKKEMVHLGAVDKAGPVMIGFETFGAKPRLARILKEEIAESYRVLAVVKR